MADRRWKKGEGNAEPEAERPEIAEGKPE